MCECTEAIATKILARALKRWRDEGKNPHEFDDDIAVEVLVREGLRPSRLSADLDHLISRAFREVMRGRA